MDKLNIISYWSYKDQKEKQKEKQTLLAEKLVNFYSKLNNIKLVNLNLLEHTFNYYYWYICCETGELYFINLIINNREYQLSKDKVSILSELNRYTYKQINFEIYESELLNNSNSFILNTTINQNNYTLNNYDIIENSVTNINKSSRAIRYIRRNILINNNINIITNTNNKRKLDQNDDNINMNKKHKENQEIDWSNMVTASSIRNYLLNDPLIDYLKEYNIRNINDIIKTDTIKISMKSKKYKSSNSHIDAFTKHIMDAGVEFEEELIKIIQTEHKVIKVAEYYQSRSENKFEETIQLMKQGVPIIYQALLYNFDNKTYGIPDLLVRSDYINKLLGYQVIDEKESKLKSIKLGTDWHYKVIDIKHSNIPLKADGIHILNSESIPAYKGQLYIYTNALNKIQGIDINKAFIWGKKYYWTCKNVKYERNNFLNKLGVIDYDDIDSEYINQTNDAIKWIQLVRNEGYKWKLLPIPSRSELFPNMKNDKDGVWKHVKYELNQKINEITSIIYCGIKHRQLAHQNQIYKWTDPKCTSKIMGFNQKGKQSTIVDSILDINRQSSDIIRPQYIKYDRINWYNQNKDHMEFYLDFETLNSNFGSIIKDGIISYNTNQYIFMIGIGYKSNDDKWIFKTFIMNEKTDDAELSMFNEFYSYINIILKEYNKQIAKLYHWSCAEPQAYSSFKNRNSDINFKDYNLMFYDLHKIFTNEPIVIKGALNFSLKTIAKTLKNHSMINTCWDESSPCSNGLTAMILANKVYENYKNELIDCVCTDNVMNEITKYNEVDCKVMFEIHELLKVKL